MKKLSLADLKKVSKSVTSAQALNAIKGGETQGCGGLKGVGTGSGGLPTTPPPKG
jgi:hypothetical protein